MQRPAPHTYADAVIAFTHEGAGDGWSGLPFFRDGTAVSIARQLDDKAIAGNAVLPAPAHIFAALAATPLSAVKAVILGQDPYPTPGDAHGLAFSVQPGRRIPGSLRNIFKEMQTDLGLSPPANGTLTKWAAQGVLLLNTCLSVEAGKAGAHRKLGWQALAHQALAALAHRAEPVAFILWGNDARALKPLVQTGHNLIVESPHPSPLSARTGFFGSKPFSQVNRWLTDQGRTPVDWRLD